MYSKKPLGYERLKKTDYDHDDDGDDEIDDRNNNNNK
jgi:hypothetical protein